MKFKALLPATALLLVTILAYLPSTGNGFIWDDDSYVYMNQTLDSPKALSHIWFKPSASPQFYPLVFTGFWIEKQLWGLNPAGYHWTNVLLHATAAILLWRILRRLELPGAFAAAAVFALHPIHVESVGWITERKNVLSGFFYLGSLLAYLRFARVDCVLILPPTLSDATKNRRKSNQPSSAARLLRKAFSPGGWGWYGFAFLLFCAALLSKTVTCSLPAVVLLLLWWKHERMTARNVSALVPFFLLGLAMGLMTATLEKQQVGAEGDEWAFTPVERCLVAGRALCFYAMKVVWPMKLTFIYPRWELDAGAWWQYLYPACALAVIACLWLARHRLGRGPLVAVLIFAGTLVPALGFFNVYPMRYSFVADHFQYLASIGLIALLTSLVVEALWHASITSAATRPLVAVAILGGLAVLTWRQQSIYKDVETLWKDTIAKNPECRMAHNNLGSLYARAGKHGEAIKHLSEAIRIKGTDPRAYHNLGMTYDQIGLLDEAVLNYSKALELDPASFRSHQMLGLAFLRTGRAAEAVDELTLAMSLNEGLHDVRAYLAVAQERSGHKSESQSTISDLKRLDPAWPLRLAEAAWFVATHPDPKLRNGAFAIELAGKADAAVTSAQISCSIKDILAAAYAEAGNFDEAIRVANEAGRLAVQTGNRNLKAQVDAHLESYQARRPWRDASLGQEKKK